MLSAAVLLLATVVLYSSAQHVLGSITGAVIGSNAAGPTLTVVSSTSSIQGDFKCTGTNDNLIIQQALFQLNATGGTLILSDGTFHISDQLFLVSNLVLKGQGIDITIIRSTDNAGPFARAGTIRGLALTNLVVQDFTGDGNRLNNLGDAYARGTISYGKFGFYCEACSNVLAQRVGMNSYTGKYLFA